MTAATTPNAALPTQKYTYAAQVRDAAGNLGVNTGLVEFAFDYFNCDQQRANTTSMQTVGTSHTTLSFVAARSTDCSGCHRTQPPGPQPNGTPAFTFVAVPRGEPSPLPVATYWCRCPP